MIDFWIVIALLPAFGRKEYFRNALAPQRLNEFPAVLKRTVVKDALNEQVITDVLLLCFRGVPEKILVLIYNLFA